MGEAEVEYSKQRRSSRVFIRLRVQAAGRNIRGERFKERCETIVVNAHGGLIYLSETLEMDAPLTLTNPISGEEQECRVVFLGDASTKCQRVGVEFLTPAPRFWGVDFPPTDWRGSANSHDAN